MGIGVLVLDVKLMPGCLIFVQCVNQQSSRRVNSGGM
jgi:hypothetical protein